MKDGEGSTRVSVLCRHGVSRAGLASSASEGQEASSWRRLPTFGGLRLACRGAPGAGEPGRPPHREGLGPSRGGSGPRTGVHAPPPGPGGDGESVVSKDR
jgi:hypothetical protein